MVNINIDFNKPAGDVSKKQKQFMMIVAAVAIIAAVVYFNFLLKPQILKIAKLTVKVNRMKADVQAAQADIAKMPKFRTDIEAYKEKVDRYEKMLPAEREIPALLEDLSSMAKNANVKIVGITPVAMQSFEKVQKSQAYQDIPILINARSGYHELGRFLSSLENSDRYMKVADIQIRSNRDSLKKHDVELLVLTYMLLKEK